MAVTRNAVVCITVAVRLTGSRKEKLLFLALQHNPILAGRKICAAASLFGPFLK